MKRAALVVAMVVLSAGCRAPMPSWEMLSPYGATRVPPPPTGGYGTPQPYYAPAPTTPPPTVAPTSAPVGTGFRAPLAKRWSNIDDPVIGPVGKGSAWGPTRPTTSNAQVVDLSDMDVVLASHETAAPTVPSTIVVEHDGPIRILPPEPSNSSPTLPRLRGMTVNDVTRSAEPQPFVPSGRVIDMSQLPDAPARSTSNQSSPTSRQSSSRQATVMDGGWKSRTTTLRVAGT